MNQSGGAGAVHVLRHVTPAPAGAIPFPPELARTERAICLVGAGLALALHCAVAVAFIVKPPVEPLSGAGGQFLEAIEVTVVDSTVLEALNRKDTQTPPSAASGAVAPEAAHLVDAADPTRQQESDRQAPVEPVPPDRKEETHTPLAPPPDSLKTEKEAAKPTPKMQEKKEVPEKDDERKEPAPSQAQSNGGTEARGITVEHVAEGAASASPGEIERYAAQVRRLLARNKPKGRGRRGAVVITFAISRSGKISFAHISTTSGNPALDRAALSAIEQTTFPEPPAGMTDSQLIYQVPFLFK
jgi:protein TonB